MGLTHGKTPRSSPLTIWRLVRSHIKIGLFFLSVGCLWQCTSETSKNKESQVQAVQDTVVSHSKINHNDEKWFRQFSGTINGTIAITMQLNRKGDVIVGNYYYDRISKPLRLIGYAFGDSVIVQEYIANGSSTGRFWGKLYANGSYTGRWSDGKAEKHFPFELMERRDSTLTFSNMTYFQTDCTYRDSILKVDQLEDLISFDTICPSFEAIQLMVGGLTPTINKKINASIESETLKMADAPSAKTFQEFVNAVKGSVYQEVSISANVQYVDTRILSICYNHDFYGGGAHPLHQSRMKNYNLEDGKEISLADIFTPSFLDKIIEIGEKEFIEVNGAEGWFYEPGQFFVPANYSISQEGVEFFYNQYEIGPYSAGMPSFFISFKKYSSGVKAMWSKKSI